MWFDSHAEGNLPEARPLLLVPVHRTSIDIYAISYFIKDFVSYVSTDSYGHNRIANAIQKRLTSALGSVVWQQKGVANRRKRAVMLAQDVERRLSNGQIVAAFTQGRYEPNSVESFEDGILGLVRRFEEKHNRGAGDPIRIPIVPVGIEYDFRGNGLVPSRFASRLARYLPLFPSWDVPAIGSSVMIRFGQPRFFDEASIQDLTREVMREAAELSRIPFVANEAMPTHNT